MSASSLSGDPLNGIWPRVCDIWSPAQEAAKMPGKLFSKKRGGEKDDGFDTRCCSITHSGRGVVEAERVSMW